MPKQAFNWPKCNYSTIRVSTIMLCFILILFVRKIPKYIGLLGLDLFQFHRLGCLGNISHKVSCDIVSPRKFLFHDSNTFLSKIGWIHLIVSFQNKSVSHYDSHMGTPTCGCPEEVIGHASFGHFTWPGEVTPRHYEMVNFNKYQSNDPPKNRMYF